MVEVHALQTGTVAVKTRQPKGIGHGTIRRINTLLDRAWTQPLPIFAYLIVHPEGLILVDTGETARATARGYFPAWHPYFRLGVREWVERDQEIDRQIERLGYRTSDVRHVVMTHMHTDHAGGIYHFPEATFWLTDAENKASLGFAGQVSGYLPQHRPEWFKPRSVVYVPEAAGSFPARYTLTSRGDVHLVPTPGHTVGHQSVVVQADGLTYFIAGDVSYTEALMQQGVVDGVAPDENAARQTLTRVGQFIRENPTVYLPAHDPDVPRRLGEKRTTTYSANA